MLDLSLYLSKRIALYGLGTETERFISEHENGLDILCLLDGYKTEGVLYGYDIWPLEKAINSGVQAIIVVARPGSCKAIAKRIGDICRQAAVDVIDVRGKDLLAENKVVYDFNELAAGTRQELKGLIEKSEVVSFDLFDTLICRKTFEYTDVFELVDRRILESGTKIEDFAKKRLSAEKELATGAPKLSDIYKKLLGEEKLFSDNIDFEADRLSELEWLLDTNTMAVRDGMKEMFDYAISLRKDIYITTDCYYTKDALAQLLDSFGISGYRDILDSCEYGKNKNNGLFHELIKMSSIEPDKTAGILHIGDDEYADVDAAKAAGLSAFRIYSGRELFYALGGLGAEQHLQTLADKTKVGLCISRLLNDPFCFEGKDKRLFAKTAQDVGYAFIGAIVSDFTHWFRGEVKDNNLDDILFCARDGYLLQKLYAEIDDNSGKYFLTSRTAAIRAGMTSQSDIDYVDSMRFFGNSKEEMVVRFGIEHGTDSRDITELSSAERTELILEKSKVQRDNYFKYIEGLGLENSPETKLAVFDFVAKGTTQLFIQKLFKGHLMGLYFLQLEPEFMKGKGLDIISFYGDAERDKSAIFDDYYILETIVTSPDASVDEFDDEGRAVFAKETRSLEAIGCVMDIQKGIEDFFADYIAIVPKNMRTINKPLDEALLSLVKKVVISDEAFYKLVVEDPFFGRMTDINDVL